MWSYDIRYAIASNKENIYNEVTKVTRVRFFCFCISIHVSMPGLRGNDQRERIEGTGAIATSTHSGGNDINSSSIDR